MKTKIENMQMQSLSMAQHAEYEEANYICQLSLHSITYKQYQDPATAINAIQRKNIIANYSYIDLEGTTYPNNYASNLFVEMTNDLTFKIWGLFGNT